MERIQKRLEKIKQRQKGFTLVELIVVIAIIGILAGVMLPKYFSFTDDARQSAAISEAKSIRSLAETEYAKNGEWPTVSSSTPEVGGTTFSGTLESGLTSSDSAGDGEFTYKAENGKYAHCDANGVVFASESDGDPLS